MKKKISLFLIVAMIFCVTACSKKVDTNITESTNVTVETESKDVTVETESKDVSDDVVLTDEEMKHKEIYTKALEGTKISYLSHITVPKEESGIDNWVTIERDGPEVTIFTFVLEYPETPYYDPYVFINYDFGEGIIKRVYSDCEYGIWHNQDTRQYLYVAKIVGDLDPAKLSFTLKMEYGNACVEVDKQFENNTTPMSFAELATKWNSVNMHSKYEKLYKIAHIKDRYYIVTGCYNNIATKSGYDMPAGKWYEAVCGVTITPLEGVQNFTLEKSDVVISLPEGYSDFGTSVSFNRNWMWGKEPVYGTHPVNLFSIIYTEVAEDQEQALYEDLLYAINNAIVTFDGGDGYEDFVIDINTNSRNWGDID